MIDRLNLWVFPAVATLMLHGLLIWAVVYVWQPPVQAPNFKKPEFVKATLVELKAKAPEKKASGSKIEKVDLTAKNAKAAALEKRKQQEAADQKAQQIKAQQIKEQKAKAAKQKAEQVKAAEDAKRKKAAAEKLAREQARQQQQALDKALLEEEMMLAEQAEAEVVNSYKSLIAERIINKWSRPPSARRGMICDLVIQLVPTGKIITVNITKSSGNQAFDRSAEQAVRAVDQIPELQNMDINTFERNFRIIHLQFNPEDRRL